MEDFESVWERIRCKTRLHHQDLAVLGDTVTQLEELVEGMGRDSENPFVTNVRISRLSSYPDSLPPSLHDSPLSDLLLTVKTDLEAALSETRDTPSPSDISSETQKPCIPSHTLHELEAAKMRIAELETCESTLNAKITTLEENLSQFSSLARQLSQDKVNLRREYEEKLQMKEDLVTYLEGQICNLQDELRERALAGLEVGPSGRASYTGVIRKTIKGGKKGGEGRNFRLSSSGSNRGECK